MIGVKLVMKRNTNTGNLIADGRIQKGLKWKVGCHEFTVTVVGLGRKRCKVVETWPGCENGIFGSYLSTYSIHKDGNKREFVRAYDGFKLYATDAINYPESTAKLDYSGTILS